MEAIMKQELQNFYTYAKKGFLLIELLLSMSILVMVISITALYQIKTMTLQQAAQKRQQARTLLDSVIETIYCTKQIPSHSFEKDGITVRVDPYYSSVVLGSSDCIFIKASASWTELSDKQAILVCVACVPQKRLLIDKE
jgi:Tfp pilus assembly protein PilV